MTEDLQKFLRERRLAAAENYQGTREQFRKLIKEMRSLSKYYKTMSACSDVLVFSERLLHAQWDREALVKVTRGISEGALHMAYPFQLACHYVGRFALMDAGRGSYLEGGDLVEEADSLHRKTALAYSLALKQAPLTLRALQFRIRAWLFL